MVWTIDHKVQTYADAPPAHHVTLPKDGWLPDPRARLAQWATGAPVAYDTRRYAPDVPFVRTGFRNPWPSWHKPTPLEVWSGLEWVSKPNSDPRVSLIPSPERDDPELHVATVPLPEWPKSLPADEVRITWIGHASALLELPLPGNSGDQAVRILFDPIFSPRCVLGIHDLTATRKCQREHAS